MKQTYKRENRLEFFALKKCRQNNKTGNEQTFLGYGYKNIKQLKSWYNELKAKFVM